jgi:hypothetical protein
MPFFPFAGALGLEKLSPGVELTELGPLGVAVGELPRLAIPGGRLNFMGDGTGFPNPMLPFLGNLPGPARAPEVIPLPCVDRFAKSIFSSTLDSALML